jgi:16S rRNA (guanine527-N7)-methyltransferase
MPILMEYLLPLTHIGGHVLAMKGDSGLAEAHQAENAIRMLGGQLAQLRPVSLPRISEDRYLVVIDKIAATHDKYPRRVGIPTKRPL